jgi:molybdopterin-guanine dinucleotide biosynthesis protein A
MGADKAGLPHPEGGTWLGRAVRVLRPWCRLTTVAGPWTPAGVPRLADAPEGAGPLAGIAAAARAYPAARYLLVLAVDLPWAEPGRLVAAARRRPGRAVVGVAGGPNQRSVVQPLAGIYPAGHGRRAAQLLARGEARAMRWLQAGPWSPVPAPHYPWHNANTPQEARELHAWETRP